MVVNHSKIQGTNTSVFTTLQEAMTEFLNTRKWSNAQYTTREKIACSFNLIVNGPHIDAENVARITNFIETDDTAVFGNSINVVSVNTE